jgi:type VI secretion system protein ImpF
VKSADYEIRVVASVLDRLIDDDPGTFGDSLRPRHETVKEFRRAVQRDLDDLLNSRNSTAGFAPHFEEIARSVLGYGLPDFSAINLKSPHGQARIRQAMETAIRVFEPRLKDVVATLYPPSSNDRSLRLHVEARLVIDPTPEAVSFDIVMPVHEGRYDVKELE